MTAVSPTSTFCATSGPASCVHESLDHLRWALAVLRREGADRLVFLGDVCGMHTDLEETIEILDDAGVVGVWGNHDFGLCGTNPGPEDRLRYSARLMTFMGRLRPRMEVEGCLFSHVEPWLDPEKLEDLWYLEGPPETPFQLARIFSAVPHRVMFVGHYHLWHLVTPEGVLRPRRGVCDDFTSHRWAIVLSQVAAEGAASHAAPSGDTGRPGAAFGRRQHRP